MRIFRLLRELLHDRRDGRARDDIEIDRLFIRCDFLVRIGLLIPVVDEVARESDAVVELWEAVVERSRRHRAAREEVELIAEVDEGAPLLLLDLLLPLLDFVDDARRSLCIELVQGGRDLYGTL